MGDDDIDMVISHIDMGYLVTLHAVRSSYITHSGTGIYSDTPPRNDILIIPRPCGLAMRFSPSRLTTRPCMPLQTRPTAAASMPRTRGLQSSTCSAQGKQFLSDTLVSVSLSVTKGAQVELKCGRVQAPAPHHHTRAILERRARTAHTARCFGRAHDLHMRWDGTRERLRFKACEQVGLSKGQYSDPRIYH